MGLGRILDPRGLGRVLWAGLKRILVLRRPGLRFFVEVVTEDAAVKEKGEDQFGDKEDNLIRGEPRIAALCARTGGLTGIPRSST